MAKETVLVVEDDENIQELIRVNLEREGYLAETASTGEEGLRAAKAHPPDLMLLDLMLPGLDGLEVCRMMKSEPTVRDVPIIMVTAKGEEADVVAGLELGADDYVTKPFSAKVLLARVRAALRRTRKRPEEGEVIKVHDIMVHPGRHEVQVAGKTVELTLTEFKILQFLAGRPGWVFTRYQIVDAVRGEEYAVTERSVDVQIVGLRKKLGPAGKYIETVRGVGYRFME